MSGRLAPAGVALACCALGFVLLVATGQDDAYITYRASHGLATTGGIVNYNGERVEQSSSLLHTIASVQAGMVMYYTALRFGSAIEFYDLKGLTTRHFMFLREAEGVGGNSWGLDLDLERYFALAKARKEPAFHAELIFDIRPLGELAARNGYAPVLEQVHEGAGLEIALGPLRLGGPALYYERAAVRSDQLR